MATIQRDDTRGGPGFSMPAAGGGNHFIDRGEDGVWRAWPEPLDTHVEAATLGEYAKELRVLEYATANLNDYGTVDHLPISELATISCPVGYEWCGPHEDSRDADNDHSEWCTATADGHEFNYRLTLNPEDGLHAYFELCDVGYVVKVVAADQVFDAIIAMFNQMRAALQERACELGMDGAACRT